MKALLPCLILIVALLGGCTEHKPVTVSAGRIDEVVVHAPSGNPTSVVIYLSDLVGWDNIDTGIVDALVARGAAVIPVDFAHYARKLDADTGACLYVVGELTQLAQRAQRSLDMAEYFAPVLVGRAQGASFAYAALADAPANTLGGAVGVGFVTG